MLRKLDVDRLAARRALYDLLGRLLLAPPDGALLHELRSLPGIAEHLPTTPDAHEALQVGYEFLFGRNVYPYQSLYVDRELLLNSAAAAAVAELYAGCGFEAAPAVSGAPDHLGLEFGLMAHLIGHEIAALEAGSAEHLGWARARQAECLAEHLARWLPLWARAVERAEPHPFYRALAQISLELVLSDLAAPHLTALPQVAAPTNPSATTESAAPQPPAGDERGLNQVVRQLLTPAEVGVFLSRSDIRALGRALGLPVPIGERFQMLRGLFEAAGQFELVEPLLGACDALFAGEAAALVALAEAHPAWAKAGSQWQARIAQGQALVAELREAC